MSNVIQEIPADWAQGQGQGRRSAVSQHWQSAMEQAQIESWLRGRNVDNNPSASNADERTGPPANSVHSTEKSDSVAREPDFRASNAAVSRFLLEQATASGSAMTAATGPDSRVAGPQTAIPATRGNDVAPAPADPLELAASQAAAQKSPSGFNQLASMYMTGQPTLRRSTHVEQDETGLHVWVRDTSIVPAQEAAIRQAIQAAADRQGEKLAVLHINGMRAYARVIKE